MGEIEANLGQARQNIEQADETSRSTIEGRLNELLSRIEQLEVEVAKDEESEDALNERVDMLERKIKELEGLKNVESRLNEMSEDLVDIHENIESQIDEKMNKELEDKMNPLLDFKDQMQETLQMQKELKESLESEQDMEDLWEVLDNEFAEIERRMHNNEAELEELRSDVAELSSLIKILTSRR